MPPIHPSVRDLYKRIIHVGKDYPKGLAWVRETAKKWIAQNKALPLDSIDFKRAVANGRHQVREMEAVVKLKKYRSLKKNYYGDEAMGSEKTGVSSSSSSNGGSSGN